ncbi:hypothetical protein K1719_046000 [Acacia pycnantha]|nr:hypothetical protein K1719_046000 [Acacia pycnantha]
MYSCKLGSLALLLALSASHHFILLHCQEPGNAPEPTESGYGSPPPPPGNAPEPTESYYGSPSLPRRSAFMNSALGPATWEPYLYPKVPTTESDTAQPPIGLIVSAVIGSVVLIKVLFACFFIWRERMRRQSAQPQPPKEEDLVSGAAAPSSSEYKDNGKD